MLEFFVEDTTNAVLAVFSPRTQTSKSSDEDLRSSGLLGDAKRQYDQGLDRCMLKPGNDASVGGIISSHRFDFG